MDVKFDIPRNPDGSKPDRVRVYPKNEAIRKGIKHPTGQIKFAGTLGESVEWPLDQFTTRRLQDGDVLLHAPGDEPQYRDQERMTVPAAQPQSDAQPVQAQPQSGPTSEPQP